MEHLEVYDWCLTSLNESSRITLDFELPNLRTLFCDSKVQASPLIASPRLEQLAFFGNFHLNSQLACLKSSLKLLKVFSFSHETDIELPNLEVLYFNGSLQIELAKFKKLREIHFDGNASDLRLALTVFADLLEQKRRLERSDLRVYFEGIRCEANSFSETVSHERLRDFFHRPPRVLIRPSDFESFQQNRDDFQVRNLRLYFEYRSEFDNVIAAMSDEQVDRLARSLQTLMLVDQLNGNLLGKFERLFRYVQRLYIDEKHFSQFDVLPAILPNLVCFDLAWLSPAGQYVVNPGNRVPPTRITSKFEGLKNPFIEGTETSPNELKQMLDGNRFFTTVTIRTGGYKAEIVRWSSFSKTLVFYKRTDPPRSSNYDLDYGIWFRCRYKQLIDVTNFSNQELVEILRQKNFFDEASIETAMSSFNFTLPKFPPDARPGDVIDGIELLEIL